MYVVQTFNTPFLDENQVWTERDWYLSMNFEKTKKN